MTDEKTSSLDGPSYGAATVTLGAQLTQELARRHELGMYFDYAGYQALRRVESPPTMVQFMTEHGLRNAPTTTDIASLADWLHVVGGKKQSAELAANAAWLIFQVWLGF